MALAKAPALAQEASFGDWYEALLAEFALHNIPLPTVGDVVATVYLSCNVQAWRNRDEQRTARLPEAFCRICGCTFYNPCDGGCRWIEPDLCSACVPRVPIVLELNVEVTHGR
jgi:hypothetical protein